MKINQNKAFFALHNNDKLPRKTKKFILGNKLNNKKLRELLANVKITPSTNNHDSAIIEPYPFCPKCGCVHIRSVNMGAEYPERWVMGYCVRCNFLVEVSDNSPYYHALEMDNYKL